MDITRLLLFVRISKYGITKANEQNFISRTTVMKQINRLESELTLNFLLEPPPGLN